VAAVQEAAADRFAATEERLTVLAGMEVTSTEEVHVVGLFPDAAAAEAAAQEVRSLLPKADADYYAFFGEQTLMCSDGTIEGEEAAALAVATTLDLNDTVGLIKRHGGLAVAAHIDRRAFGVLSQLGWFPEDAGFDGVEVSRHLASDSPRLEEFRAYGLPVTGSSDGHYLHEIGLGMTVLTLAEPSFSEVALAFASEGGRRVDRA
jgi:3',5'-nucleoside bisphosphate phosphatase